MIVQTLVVNDMQTNCYIVKDEDTNEAIIIDPGDEADYIIDTLQKNACNVKAILLTHGHFDHIGAVEELKHKLNVPIYAHQNEQMILQNSDFNLSGSFGSKKVELSADNLFEDGDIFNFGNIALKVIHTLGHTPGGVSYYIEKENILFSGDTLFFLSIGRTDFPYGNYQALIASIKDKLFLLPDETKVYTGHGESTNIGKEKQSNPCILDAFWD